MLYTTSCKQSSATEDGRNYHTKHVEMLEIINKIIIVASSWLFILLYYYFTTQFDVTLQLLQSHKEISERSYPSKLHIF